MRIFGVAVATVASLVIGIWFANSLRQHAYQVSIFPSGLFPIAGEPKTYSWHFVNDASGEAEPTALVSILLTLDDQNYHVGSYPGRCFELGSSRTPLIPDQRIAVQCWSPNTGNEVAVFVRKGKLVIGHTYLSRENPEMRGDVEILFEL